MALGSSAPEILLSVLETMQRLGKEAGALGPSTIVGSAAFNLLFISAVCIPAVDEPKKIFDMGVFTTTAVFSLFAYLWLYYCLSVSTPE
jgi:Ca2+/Na+ antiporter